MENPAKNKNTSEQNRTVSDNGAAMPAPGKTTDNNQPFLVQAPAIALPKGGGAIKGIDEKFSVNAVNGTASFSIPIPVSAARACTPALLLSYSPGAGNGIFGLGWSLSLPSIKRKTDKGLPQYTDATDGDVYLLSEAEDLVPQYEKDDTGNFITDANGQWVVYDKEVNFNNTLYRVRRYQPRIEGSFTRIERWTDPQTQQIHWRTISKDNITTRYGLQPAAVIADPIQTQRIFEWLPELIYDDKGNCAVYEYKQEDAVGMDAARPHNHNRSNGYSAFANAYLKRIRYGNLQPFSDHLAAVPAQFMFETVFDYGEHDEENIPYNEIRPWPFRTDAFSDYRAGFEIRTARLCKRVLLYHHFAELPGGSALVRSLNLQYGNNGLDGFTFLTASTITGYTKHDDGSYTQKSFPPFTFTYQQHEWSTTVKAIGREELIHAPSGIDEANYRFIDLYSEGLAGILSEQPGAWLYKSNLGDGRFSPATAVWQTPSFQDMSASLQLTELQADGMKQLANWGGAPKGFFELSREQQWQPFIPFENIPNIDFHDANTRLIDLDGDGLADLLITEQDVFTWYPSKGKKGFDACRSVVKETDEEKGPAIVFADGRQTIFLADMSGDGLPDIVRIRNGEVCYWPHLGYGKFGARINMDDAPLFDYPDQFDPSCIKLADIDGSGTTDIIYHGQNRVRIWLNRQGNGFAEAPVQFELPAIDRTTMVSVTDLLGNGVLCMVWNSTLPAHQQAPLQYIDLMNSKKPHLLTGYANNLGKEVVMEYTPSTRYYIRDKIDGTPWVTKLHFPVHCVSKVTVFDRIRKTRFASEYSYHHGYYDHHEREFRGFGRVEQTDVEAIDHFIKEDSTGNVIEQHLHQPPVLTKSWYHTGAFLDGHKILDQFAHEYFQNTWTEENLLPQPELPPGLSVEEWRQALRSCKGALLRKEVYALDNSPLSDLPYVTEQHNCLIKILQPQGSNKHGVFLTHESESITYHYERNPADPRIAHNLVLDIDNYGNVLQTAAVVYGRRSQAGNEPEQEQTHIIFTDNGYTRSIEETLDYRAPGLYVTRSFEVTGITPADNYFTLQQIKESCNAAAFLDYEQTASGGQQKRLIEFVRTQYRADDGVTVLPFGTIGSKGLVHQTYKAAFNQQMLAGLFSDKIAMSDLQNILTDANRGAYVLADGYYWICSGTRNYEADKFFLSTLFTNPFGKVTTAVYDACFLFVRQLTDPVGNETHVQGFNYRTLSPYWTLDANDNASAVRFDELGMVVKSFVIGKKGIDAGDELDDTRTEYKDATDFAGVEMEYDLHQWYNQAQTPGFDYASYKPRPNFVKTRSRETHYHAHPLHETRWQQSVAYSDGGGQIILLKVQAEPGPALQVNEDGTVTTIPNTAPGLRWAGNGRTILNNKGNPVKKYEPYFSVSPSFDDEKEMVQLGVTPVMHYDPPGRVIRTDLPDKTFSKVTFTPWQQTTWDPNDTVRDSEWYADRGSPDPAGPEPGEPSARAAWLAAKHHNTPAVAHLDSLGRTFLTATDKGEIYLHTGELPGDNKLSARVVFDIEGNELEIRDAWSRKVMQYDYDMLGNKIKQTALDNGRCWMINDVAGKPLLNWNDRDHLFCVEYDQVGRPLLSTVQEGAGAILVYSRTQYGETEANAKEANLKGKVYKNHDQAAVTTNHGFDFKGNLLHSSKQLVENYKTVVDWTVPGNIVLDADVFESSTGYDALNRPVRQVTPHITGTLPTEVLPGYNEAGLLNRIQVSIRGAAMATTFVSNITYNARARREEIYYGNNTVTKYAYNPVTFRLARLLTTRNAGADVLQDLRYYYDPTGNITNSKDEAHADIFFDGQQVTALNSYEYDALYRLVKATGRKHAGQTDVQPVSSLSGNDHFRNHPFINSSTINPNDANAFRNYTEQYMYDKAGNMLSQQHIASNSSWTRTFEYDHGNSLDNHLTGTTTGSDTFSYTYDAHGNMHGLETVLSEVWDFMDHFKEADLGGGGRAYYVYDGNRQRIRKVIERSDGSRKERIYLGGIELYRERNSVGTVTLERETLHIMDGQQRIAMVDTPVIKPAGNNEVQLIRYQYSNHLGSASLELDDQAQVISYEEFFPFGTTSYTTIDAAREVAAKRYRYTGKERDEETGLNYHGARYYALWLCRWTAADPIGIKDGLNIFLFCNNNPVTFFDPNGTDARLSVDQKTHTITYSTTVHFYATAAEIKELTPVAAKAEKFFAQPRIETGSDAENRLKGTPGPARSPEFTDGSGVKWTVKYEVKYQFHDIDKIKPVATREIAKSDPTAFINNFSETEKQLQKDIGYTAGDNILTYAPKKGITGGTTSLITTPNAAAPTFGEPESRMVGQIAKTKKFDKDTAYEAIIHETGHMLGFDERYTGGFPQAHKDYEHDFMTFGSGKSEISMHPEHIKDSAQFGIAVANKQNLSSQAVRGIQVNDTGEKGDVEQFDASGNEISDYRTRQNTLASETIPFFRRQVKGTPVQQTPAVSNNNGLFTTVPWDPCSFFFLNALNPPKGMKCP